jgi:hypothetical protein
MRAERKVSETADIEAPHTLGEASDTLCGSSIAKFIAEAGATTTTCLYHVTHLAHTELHREVETSQMETSQTQLAIVPSAILPSFVSKGISVFGNYSVLPS